MMPSRPGGWWRLALRASGLLVLGTLLSRCSAGTEAAPLPPEAQAFLDVHAARRAAHCAPPLTWDPAIAESARAWADNLAARSCVLAHSPTDRYGENLAKATTGSLDAGAVTDAWYLEGGRYDHGHPGFDAATSHFTQVVWLDTRRIGCAHATCREGWTIWVCQYDPPGNVAGRFDRAVRPNSCADAR